MQKGDTFSETFKVTPEIYQGFINLFKDRNPLHTDQSFARENGFAGEVMHGNILNGFLSYFIGECLPQKNVIIQTQSIQYALPVHLNDELILNAEVKDIFESVNTIEIKYQFTNSAGKKVAKGNIQIGLLK